MFYRIIILIALLLKCISSSAQLQPFSLISDNMVLQRNIEVPIWGEAIDSKTITIEFNGQKKQTTVVDGKWMLKLDAMKASIVPLEMRIIGDKDEVIIRDILIGEVWLAGGQSNMERQLGLRPPQKPLLNWEIEAAQANFPLIREFALPLNANTTVPVKNINSKWIVCDTASVKLFSAIGYYFAKNLFLQKQLPIGIIHSSWGGTPIQKWISKDALESNPDFVKVVEDYNKAIADYPNAITSYIANRDSLYAKWLRDSLYASQSGKILPLKPIAPLNPMLSGHCGGLFKTMIEPLIPYAIKGVIWYQGESNVSNVPLYLKLFPALIKDWRSKWGLGDFPFLFVQLAPFKTNTPELRENQLLTKQMMPNTAMVVTIDCGDTTDIHPANKKVVGDRLALAARALAYNEKLEYEGPEYISFKIKHDKFILKFKHIGKGLMVKGIELTGFTISENSKDFVKAKAVIKNNKVIVSAEGIKNPIEVRYGFINNAFGNLFNKEGLPASPFRTNLL